MEAININTAATGSEEGLNMFQYHPWDEEQIRKRNIVRRVLEDAVAAIIKNVPPGPDRSTAIRKIREARMDANSAITHGGKY